MVHLQCYAHCQAPKQSAPDRGISFRTRWPSSSLTAWAWSDCSPSRTCGDRDKTISLRAIVE